MEAGTLHGTIRHVVSLLRYVQSQLISNYEESTHDALCCTPLCLM